MGRLQGTSEDNDGGRARAKPKRRPYVAKSIGSVMAVGRTRRVKSVGRHDDRHFDPITGRRL